MLEVISQEQFLEESLEKSQKKPGEDYQELPIFESIIEEITGGTTAAIFGENTGGIYEEIFGEITRQITGGISE